MRPAFVVSHRHDPLLEIIQGLDAAADCNDLKPQDNSFMTKFESIISLLNLYHYLLGQEGESNVFQR